MDLLTFYNKKCVYFHLITGIMYFGGKRDSESTLSQMCDVAAGDDQTIRLQGGGIPYDIEGLANMFISL